MTSLERCVTREAHDPEDAFPATLTDLAGRPADAHDVERHTLCLEFIAARRGSRDADGTLFDRMASALLLFIVPI
jgi:hypothetical protein